MLVKIENICSELLFKNWFKFYKYIFDLIDDNGMLV